MPENCQEAELEFPSCSCSRPVSPGHPERGRAGQLGRLSTTGCPRAQQGCTGCPCHLQPQQKPSWLWHNLSLASHCGLSSTQLMLATSTVATTCSLSMPCPGSRTWSLEPELWPHGGTRCQAGMQQQEMCGQWDSPGQNKPSCPQQPRCANSAVCCWGSS